VSFHPEWYIKAVVVVADGIAICGLLLFIGWAADKIIAKLFRQFELYEALIQFFMERSAKQEQRRRNGGAD
jgi:hypothetical protein